MTQIETLEEMLRHTKEVERLASLSSLDTSELSRLKYRLLLLKGQAWLEFSKRGGLGIQPMPYRSCLLATHITLASVDPNDLPDGRKLSNLMYVIREDIERTIQQIQPANKIDQVLLKPDRPSGTRLIPNPK